MEGTNSQLFLRNKSLKSSLYPINGCFFNASVRLKLIESFCYEPNVDDDDDDKGNNTGYSSRLPHVNLEKWNLKPHFIDWEAKAQSMWPRIVYFIKVRAGI